MGIAGTAKTAGGSQPQQPAGTEQEQLAAVLERKQEEAPDLWELMKEAQEQAEARRQQLQLPKNSARYGDAPLEAYARLTRAKNKAQVSSASGYARRQIAQLQAAKRRDPDNAQRIQAAINQLRKAVNRAGKKSRELDREKLEENRRKRLEEENRRREAQRLKLAQNRSRTMRIMREAGYLQEAAVDNRQQNQLAAARMELREQARQLAAASAPGPEAGIQQYAAAQADAELPAGEAGAAAWEG